MEKTIDYSNPKFYENRELSWIKFDERVLEEARDKTIPLLERLKFLSITSSNLDEFFMVRVASLKDMVHANYKKKDIAGMTATEQLLAINEATRKLVDVQYSTYNRLLAPQLNKEGIFIINKYEDLSEKQAKFVDRYFMESVYPVLTPMAVDASRPFPLIRNKTLDSLFLSGRNVSSGSESSFSLGGFFAKDVALVLAVSLNFSRSGELETLLRAAMRFHFWHNLFLRFYCLF